MNKLFISQLVFFISVLNRYESYDRGGGGGYGGHDDRGGRFTGWLHSGLVPFDERKPREIFLFATAILNVSRKNTTRR